MVGTSGNAVRLFIYRSSDEPPTQNPNGSMSPWTQIYLPPISKTESWVTTAIRFFPNSNGGQKLAVASFPVETSSSRRKINYKIAFYQYLPESMSVHYSHNPVHIPLEVSKAYTQPICLYSANSWID